MSAFFRYLVLLLRQLTRTFWVIDYPRTIKIDIATMTAKTGSPTGVAEGGGLGDYLKARAIALRNLMTSAINSMTDDVTTGRQVRALTPGEQAVAA